MLHALSEQVEVDEVLLDLLNRKIDQHACDFWSKSLACPSLDKAEDGLAGLRLVSWILSNDSHEHLRSLRVVLVTQGILRRSKLAGLRSWHNRCWRIHWLRHLSIGPKLLRCSLLLTVLMLLLGITLDSRATSSRCMMLVLTLHTLVLVLSLLIVAIVEVKLLMSLLIVSLVLLGLRPVQTLRVEARHQKSKNLLKLAFVLVPRFVTKDVSLVRLEVLGVLRLLVLHVALLLNLVEVDVERSSLKRKICVLSSARTIRSLIAYKSICVLFILSRHQQLKRLDFTKLLEEVFKNLLSGVVGEVLYKQIASLFRSFELIRLMFKLLNSFRLGLPG